MVRASPIKFHHDIFEESRIEESYFSHRFSRFSLSLLSFILEDNLIKEFLVTYVVYTHTHVYAYFDVDPGKVVRICVNLCMRAIGRKRV